MLDLIRQLWPIHRSVCGPGLRETISKLGERVPIELMEIPSGTPVFDWVVPNEWKLNRATLRDPFGKIVVDTAVRDLHVINFSTPIHQKNPLDELQPHLHSILDKPTWTPYRTSYYTPTWGFCLPKLQLDELESGEYEAHIDTEIKPGSLTMGECVLKGDGDEEFLFSIHCCHPQLANDNLSAMAVALKLIEWLSSRPRRWTYRFLFLPGTIGSITWLAHRSETARKNRAGIVLSCLGDSGPIHFKQPRTERGITSLIVESARDAKINLTLRPFEPYGYDERQYSSPAFDMQIGNLTRTPNGKYPEYHTSADDLSFIREVAMRESLALIRAIVERLERDGLKPLTVARTPQTGALITTNPHCEPMLGKRGIYRGLAGGQKMPALDLALLWVLSLSDGTNLTDDIIARSKLDQSVVEQATNLLRDVELIRPAKSGEVIAPLSL